MNSLFLALLNDSSEVEDDKISKMSKNQAEDNTTRKSSSTEAEKSELAKQILQVKMIWYENTFGNVVNLGYECVK